MTLDETCENLYHPPPACFGGPVYRMRRRNHAGHQVAGSPERFFRSGEVHEKTRGRGPGLVIQDMGPSLREELVKAVQAGIYRSRVVRLTGDTVEIDMHPRAGSRKLKAELEALGFTVTRRRF